MKLLVQALLKLQEKTIKVKCRQQDMAVVKNIVPGAIKAYQSFMKKECGVTPKCAVTVDNKSFVPASSPGGIVALGHHSKIICDNTLETRLKTAFEDLKPILRYIVFPSSVSMESDPNGAGAFKSN